MSGKSAGFCFVINPQPQPGFCFVIESVNRQRPSVSIELSDLTKTTKL